MTNSEHISPTVPEFSRRRLLGAFVAAGCLVLVPEAIGHTVSAVDAGETLDRRLQRLFGHCADDAICATVQGLEEGPSFSASVDRLERLQKHTDAEFLHALATFIKSDFEHDDIVNLSGWQISVTEAYILKAL
ncbi:hypothetical protein GCM10017044_25830 [Kordiimonas sediminis]|uniref:Uncharacterized protein n=2 Tax=Kordiimonas sediminis TaxID=1735581 RepID=A0A919EA60_9PROT|nr:hypothetical protein GCM10017044_25830 [Kordiimonas sediminis]